MLTDDLVADAQARLQARIDQTAALIWGDYFLLEALARWRGRPA